MKRNGITLLEILIVAAILAVLAIILTPQLMKTEVEPSHRVEVRAGQVVQFTDHRMYLVHSVETNGVLVSLIQDSSKADDVPTLVPLSWSELSALDVKIIDR